MFFFLIQGRLFVSVPKVWTSSVKGKEAYTKSRAAWGAAQARNQWERACSPGAAGNGRKLSYGREGKITRKLKLLPLKPRKGSEMCVEMSEGLGEQNKNDAIARKGCNGNFASRFSCTPSLLPARHVPKLLHSRGAFASRIPSYCTPSHPWASRTMQETQRKWSRNLGNSI